MNLSYLYKLDLPFNKNDILFRDITTKEQIDLQKINLYYPQDTDYYLNYYESIAKIVESCLENKEILKNINIIEMLLIAIKIRIVSFGNILEFNIESKQEDIKNVKIKIDLNDLIRNILITSIDSLEIKEIEENDIKIILSWPNVNSIKFFYNLYFAEISSEEKLLESLPEYIDSIIIKDEIIKINKFTHDQKENICDKLPMSLQTKIQESIIKNINNLLSKNIFNIRQLDDEKLNFYTLSFIRILKMIFSQNPRRIYEEVYILSNFNLDSNYIMSLTPIERKLYLSFVESQQKSNQPKTDQIDQQMHQHSSAVNDLAVEFGDTPPN